MNTKLFCTDRDLPSLLQIARRQRRRRAVTLLELVIASSMLAVIVTSLSLVLRTARASWEANDNDYAALHHAHAVARHFVRQAREAHGVSNLPSSGDSITLELSDGSLENWRHVSSSGDLNDVILVSLPASGQQIPLAFNIRDLSFTGYEADGVSVATNVDDMRLVEIRVTVVLPRGARPRQTVSSRVWIRAW